MFKEILMLLVAVLAVAYALPVESPQVQGEPELLDTAQTINKFSNWKTKLGLGPYGGYPAYGGGYGVQAGYPAGYPAYGYRGSAYAQPGYGWKTG